MPWEQPPIGSAFRVLVRHADAGLRSQRPGSDDWRGLTEVGEHQAEAVAHALGELPVLRILSSPSLRCRQTVLPLAVALGLDVEPQRELTAQAAPDDVLGLLADPATAAAVLCTHRETLQALFAHLAAPAAAVAGVTAMPMAAVWTVRGSVAGPAPAHWDYVGSSDALVRVQDEVPVR